MNIEQFMQGYKAAWEHRDESMFCALFAADGEYHTTPRKPGDPLPRMVLDGVLRAEFDGGLCKKCQIWWHSMPLAR